MSESKPTPDQLRAKHAWEAVLEASKDVKGFPKYLGAARKLPVRIMASGLGQAVVFVRAKAAKTPALKMLIQHLSDWVLRQPPNGALVKPPLGENELIEAIIGTKKPSTADDLRQFTAETLAYLRWLNRFCEATGVTEEEVDE